MTRYITTLALALVTGLGLLAGTMSQWGTSGSDGGTISAGSLDIRLGAEKGVDELEWDSSLTCNTFNMGPGDQCFEDINVHNDGSLTLEYTIDPIDSSSGCFPVTVTGINKQFPPGGSVGPGEQTLESGQAHKIGLEFTVSSDNACSGIGTHQVGITVTATPWTGP